MDEFNPTEPQPVALPPEPVADPLPFRRPADYYAATEKDLRPLFPRWVPIGCGWAAVTFVVLLFIAGSLAPKSGSALDWLFGRISDDITAHFQRDVTATQKAEFGAEMKSLRAAASAGRIRLDKTQSFLNLVTEVDGDEKINQAEADKLIAAMRDLNRGVKK
jgi:hypothetical protein